MTSIGDPLPMDYPAIKATLASLNVEDECQFDDMVTLDFMLKGNPIVDSRLPGVDFNDQSEDYRMLARFIVEDNGGTTEGYHDGKLHMRIPLKWLGIAMALNRIGMERTSLYRFPPGSDCQDKNLIHDGYHLYAAYRVV